ncbi:MAG: Swt1 family HEPN domain-containing protein [Candidatus Binatus sp.]|uniref:Swt1 family HEPN domain-containing protein n=2 Tax=Candidatus Binatus sp. TaxID=2811406 RepID=UPI003BAE3703
MKCLDAIRLFGMTSLMIEGALDAVEKQFSVDLGRPIESADDKDGEYFPQFEDKVRSEASQMAEHYEVFYCLELSTRELIKTTLEASHGVDWWNKTSPEIVPSAVKQNAAANMKRELDSGVTTLSTDALDYTTFGELGEIVRSNWQVFSDTFNSQGAFNKIMSSLNTLRAPIAHCSSMAPDEVVRLRLTLRDWFRLMA